MDHKHISQRNATHSVEYTKMYTLNEFIMWCVNFINDKKKQNQKINKLYGVRKVWIQQSTSLN